MQLSVAGRGRPLDSVSEGMMPAGGANRAGFFRCELAITPWKDWKVPEHRTTVGGRLET